MTTRGYPVSIAPAIVFSIFVFVLLLMVTISTPLWDAIYFLQLESGPNEPNPLPSNTIVRFGAFGFTNGSPELGYSPADWSRTGVKDPTVDESGLRGITNALVLHPIAALFSVLTFGFTIVGLCSRAGAVLGSFAAGISTILTLVAFIVDMVLFSILKARFTDPPYNERTTSYGPAVWITLAALIGSMVTLASAAFTAFSHHRYPRKWETEEYSSGSKSRQNST